MLESKSRSISSYILFILFSFLFISAVSAQSPIITEDRNVLIVGVSGLRGDAFMAANTPNFDQFMNSGDYSYDCDVGLKTIGGPSWSTILTGVWFKKHNVKSDDFKKPMFDLYPHFYANMEYTALRTSSLANWPAINEQIDCCSDIHIDCKIDRMVNERAIELINNDQVDVLFTQYSDVDEAGTLTAYSTSSSIYIKAIERMDRYFTGLLDAVKQQAMDSGEQWLIIVCTDHGGDGNEYAGKQKMTEVRMVPQLMAVCNSDGSIGIDMDDFYASLSEAANVNIVPTVLDYLGIDLPYHLDGESYLMPLDVMTNN